MSLAILFHFLCAQHVSGINIAIIRSLRLCCWITISVVLFSVRCVLENKTTDVVIQQYSRKLLMMDILMSETCWAHKKWNKIATDIKLVFYSSTITMMLGPINIRFGYITCVVMLFWLNLRKWQNLKLPFCDWNSSANTMICYELTDPGNRFAFQQRAKLFPLSTASRLCAPAVTMGASDSISLW